MHLLSKFELKIPTSLPPNNLVIVSHSSITIWSQNTLLKCWLKSLGRITRSVRGLERQDNVCLKGEAAMTASCCSQLQAGRSAPVAQRPNSHYTAAVYMLTMWRYVQTAAWPQPDRSLTAAWPQPEPQPDRSSLYINNGDVTQTAAVRTAAISLGHLLLVRTAAVCLGHNI